MSGIESINAQKYAVACYDTIKKINRTTGVSAKLALIKAANKEGLGLLAFAKRSPQVDCNAQLIDWHKKLEAKHEVVKQVASRSRGLQLA